MAPSREMAFFVSACSMLSGRDWTLQNSPPTHFFMAPVNGRHQGPAACAPQLRPPRYLSFPFSPFHLTHFPGFFLLSTSLSLPFVRGIGLICPFNFAFLRQSLSLPVAALRWCGVMSSSLALPHTFSSFFFPSDFCRPKCSGAPPAIYAIFGLRISLGCRHPSPGT